MVCIRLVRQTSCYLVGGVGGLGLIISAWGRKGACASFTDLRTYVRTKAGARTMINIKYSNVQLIIQSHGGNIQLFILEYISLTIN
jgi:hypothetical protein